MSTISMYIRYRGSVESLICGGIMVDALVDGAVDTNTLTLTLGLCLKFALGFGN